MCVFAKVARWLLKKAPLALPGLNPKQISALKGLKSRWEQQIAVNSESDYWYSMVGAAMKCDVELIEALLAGSE